MLANRSTRAPVLGVTEQDQRLVREIQIAGIDEHLARRRESLRAALALDAPEARLQRRRSRGPDQPVLVVQHLEQPTEPSGPSLGRVRPVLRRPERVVGDEQLAPSAIEHAPDLVWRRCTRAPPSRRSGARARASPRSRSCPSRAGRSAPRTDAGRARRGPARTRASARTRAPAPARASTSKRGPTPDVGIDQIVEIAQARARTASRRAAAGRDRGSPRFPPRPSTTARLPSASARQHSGRFAPAEVGQHDRVPVRRHPTVGPEAARRDPRTPTVAAPSPSPEPT